MSKIYKTTYSLLKSTQMDQNNNHGNNRNNGQQYPRPQQNTQSDKPQLQTNAAENVLNRVRSNKVTNAIEIGFAVVGAGTVLYKGGKLLYTKAIKPAAQAINAKVVKPIVAKVSKKPANEPAPEKPAGE